jgi:hypothetical protein
MLGMQRVKSCVKCRGALKYNDGIVSTHRGLYVDLDPATLFGGATDDPRLQHHLVDLLPRMKRRWKHT